MRMYTSVPMLLSTSLCVNFLMNICLTLEKDGHLVPTDVSVLSRASSSDVEPRESLSPETSRRVSGQGRGEGGGGRGGSRREVWREP